MQYLSPNIIMFAPHDTSSPQALSSPPQRLRNSVHPTQGWYEHSRNIALREKIKDAETGVDNAALSEEDDDQVQPTLSG